MKIPKEKVMAILDALMNSPACADSDGIIRITWLGKMWGLKPRKKEKK